MFPGDHDGEIEFWAIGTDLLIRNDMSWEEVLEVSEKLLVLKLPAFVHIQEEARVDVQDVQDLHQMRLESTPILASFEV